MKTKSNPRPNRALSSGAEEVSTLNVEAQRDTLKRDYLALFSGETGQRVLDDLLRRYGWREGVEQPSYRVGMGHADMCFVEGQKEVVRHILTMKQPIKEG